MAYVGTFSSPLRDVLPTQVDLPPGNGRGIHLFRMDRATRGVDPRRPPRDGDQPEQPRPELPQGLACIPPTKPIAWGTTSRARSVPSPSIGRTGI